VEKMHTTYNNKAMNTLKTNIALTRTYNKLKKYLNKCKEAINYTYMSVTDDCLDFGRFPWHVLMSQKQLD
jgi:hypothetical protein